MCLWLGKGKRGSKVAWLFWIRSTCSYLQCFKFIFCLWSKNDQFCSKIWPMSAHTYCCRNWSILLLSTVIDHILIVQSVPRCQVTFGTNSEYCLGKLILTFKCFFSSFFFFFFSRYSVTFAWLFEEWRDFFFLMIFFLRLYHKPEF